MTTVTIDAADAVELAEILTHFLEQLSTSHTAAQLLTADLDPYTLEDVRADLNRLIKILDAS